MLVEIDVGVVVGELVVVYDMDFVDVLGLCLEEVLVMVG